MPDKNKFNRQWLILNILFAIGLILCCTLFWQEIKFYLLQADMEIVNQEQHKLDSFDREDYYARD